MQPQVLVHRMYGKELVVQPLFRSGYYVPQILRVLFQHPLLDVVATHPVYVDTTNNITTLPISFPLEVQATTAGPSSNWYDSTSQQYLIDSACDIAAYDMFFTINKIAFSMETTSKPYICTFMGPGDYEFPVMHPTIRGYPSKILATLYCPGHQFCRPSYQ